MQKEVKKSWALFIGIGTMMIAHGLQMQIMGIRSVLEDFSVFTTDLLSSMRFPIWLIKPGCLKRLQS